MSEKLSKIETAVSVATGLAGAGLTAAYLYEPSLTNYLNAGVAIGAIGAGVTKVANACTDDKGFPFGFAIGIYAGLFIGAEVTNYPSIDSFLGTLGGGAVGGLSVIAADSVDIWSKSPLKFYRNAVATALLGSALLYGGHKLTQTNYSPSTTQTNSISAPVGFEKFSDLESTVEAKK